MCWLLMQCTDYTTLYIPKVVLFPQPHAPLRCDLALYRTRTVTDQEKTAGLVVLSSCWENDHHGRSVTTLELRAWKIQHRWKDSGGDRSSGEKGPRSATVPRQVTKEAILNLGQVCLRMTPVLTLSDQSYIRDTKWKPSESRQAKEA